MGRFKPGDTVYLCNPQAEREGVEKSSQWEVIEEVETGGFRCKSIVPTKAPVRPIAKEGAKWRFATFKEDELCSEEES